MVIVYTTLGKKCNPYMVCNEHMLVQDAVFGSDIMRCWVIWYKCLIRCKTFFNYTVQLFNAL